MFLHSNAKRSMNTGEWEYDYFTAALRHPDDEEFITSVLLPSEKLEFLEEKLEYEEVKYAFPLSGSESVFVAVPPCADMVIPPKELQPGNPMPEKSGTSHAGPPPPSIKDEKDEDSHTAMPPPAQKKSKEDVSGEAPPVSDPRAGISKSAAPPTSAEKEKVELSKQTPKPPKTKRVERGRIKEGEKWKSRSHAIKRNAIEHKEKEKDKSVKA
jgi:hypothetical protein